MGKLTDSASAAKVEALRNDYSVLLSPIVTEKSSFVGGQGNVLVFRVQRSATKTDIRQAVERIFKVNVEGVRTCNYLGKPKRTARSTGRRTGFKKAYITLREGQTINVVEGL